MWGEVSEWKFQELLVNLRFFYKYSDKWQWLDSDMSVEVTEALDVIVLGLGDVRCQNGSLKI